MDRPMSVDGWPWWPPSENPLFEREHVLNIPLSLEVSEKSVCGTPSSHLHFIGMFNYKPSSDQGVSHWPWNPPYVVPIGWPSRKPMVKTHAKLVPSGGVISQDFLYAIQPTWLVVVKYLFQERDQQLLWLVVGPPLWKIWTSTGMIRNPIYGKIKNVPNHQPAYICMAYSKWLRTMRAGVENRSLLKLVVSAYAHGWPEECLPPYFGPFQSFHLRQTSPFLGSVSPHGLMTIGPSPAPARWENHSPWHRQRDPDRIIHHNNHIFMTNITRTINWI